MYISDGQSIVELDDVLAVGKHKSCDKFQIIIEYKHGTKITLSYFSREYRDQMFDKISDKLDKSPTIISEHLISFKEIIKKMMIIHIGFSIKER